MSHPTPGLVAVARSMVARARANARDVRPAQAHDWMDVADELEASINAQEEGGGGLPDVRPASPLFGCGPLHHGETLMAGERVLSLTLGGDLLAEVCVAGPYDSTEVMSAIVEAWNAHDSHERLRAELRRVTAERDQLFADLTGPGSVTHRNRPSGERTEGRISMFSDEEQKP